MVVNSFVSSLSSQFLRHLARIPFVSWTYQAMIYLVPLLDALGNRPIWYIAILPLI